MLKQRIIPTLLWKNVGLVKGVSFDSWRRVGSVLPAIKVYDMREVDELILLDITATSEERLPDYDTIAEVAAECFVPLTVGGGVNSIEVIRNLLLAGADKVAINSAAYKQPNLISEAADRFGSQCVVVSIDARREENGTYQCYSHSGSRPTGKEAGVWAQEMQLLGAGEILITSIELDGTMQGYDLELIKKVTEKVTIPVIASGGAGNYLDMYAAITEAKASAVAAASIFHFTENTPLEAKKFLSSKGVPVRNVNVRSEPVE